MVRFVGSGVVAVMVLVSETAPAEQPVSCTTLTAAQLGTLPLNVQVGEASVEFKEWATTDLKADTLVGFAFNSPVPLHWEVKAGEDVWEGEGERFIHPRGVVGPRVKAISGLTLCEAGQ